MNTEKAPSASLRQPLAKSPGLLLSFSLALVALLRLPSLRWGVISDDEAIYDAMAQVINRGGTMYRDALDHKPPGLAYLYAGVERLVGAHGPGMLGITAVHCFGIVLALLTAYGLYLLALELMDRKLAWIPALLYGVVTTSRCAYDGLALNGEILMNAPTVFAILAVVKASRFEVSGLSARARKAGLDFFAGFLMGLAGLAKWQALVAGIAFPFLDADKKQWLKNLFFRGPLWLLGLVTPIALTAWFFTGPGVLPEFLKWGGLFNLRYISEGPDWIWSLERLGIQLAAVVLPSLIFYVAAFTSLSGRFEKRLPYHWGLAIWAILSLLSTAIGGRFFGHYFLQAELPLCIFAAAPLAWAFRRAPRTIAASMAFPALFFFAVSSVPAWTHQLFDPNDPDWAPIGNAIAHQTQPDDTIFVWGNVPELYYYAGRSMGTRFSFCNYLTGLSPGTRSEYEPGFQPASVDSAWPLLFEDLQKRRPAVIVDTAQAGWKSYSKFKIARYPEFYAYLKAHYQLVSRSPASLDGAVLYRRID